MSDGYYIHRHHNVKEEMTAGHPAIVMERMENLSV
jgi:hypothetical protein